MTSCFGNILLVLTFIHLASCAQDPFLKPVNHHDDSYSYKDIRITNNSGHAVGVCEFSQCDFSVPAGQTMTVAVRYFNYDKTKTQDYVSITIQTAANRQIAPLKSMSWTPFLTEGSEVRWLGNFSGTHTFIVSAELATAAGEFINSDDDYDQSIENGLKFARLLNLLDANLTLQSQIYQKVLELTLPENDSEVYWGSGSTTESDGAKADGSIVVAGWRYERVEKQVSKVLFRGYTTHGDFVCSDGGCFPEP